MELLKNTFILEMALAYPTFKWNIKPQHAQTLPDCITILKIKKFAGIDRLN